MSFRRLPFQFSTDNPADRHSELMRRFGVPTDDKMFIDNPNIPINVMDGHSSPRLQHRLPGFLSEEGRPVKVNRESYAENVDSQKKEPKVRVVPIQIEGDNSGKKVCRQRVKSGGAAIPSSPADVTSEELFRPRSHSGTRIPHFNSDLTSNPVSHEPNYVDRTNEEKSQPREFNIPIVLEGGNKKFPPSRSVPIKKESITKQGGTRMGNGPCVSKSATEPVVKKPQKPDFNIPLKQIEDILKEFETYKDGVDKFSGVQGDKQYRYLDEMLTRCMIKLDNIETMGNEEVRQARKAAVRQVQSAIDKLDSKVQTKAGKKSEGDEKGMDVEEKDGDVTETNTESNAKEDNAADETMEETTMEENVNLVDSSIEQVTKNAGKGDSTVEKSLKQEIENLVDSSIEQITVTAERGEVAADETMEESSKEGVDKLTDSSVKQVAGDSAVNPASNDYKTGTQIQLPVETVSLDDVNKENKLTTDEDTKNSHPSPELLEDSMEVEPMGNSKNSNVPIEVTVTPHVVEVNETPALASEHTNTEGTVPSVNGIQNFVPEEDKSMDLDENEVVQKEQCESSPKVETSESERTGTVEIVNEVTDVEMQS